MIISRRALLAAIPLAAQNPNYPPRLEGFEKEVYRKVDGVELSIWILGRAAGPAKPAAVFFFGGGWANGTPSQFEHQARLLVEKGMTVFLADYRVKSRHNVMVPACVADAKAAIRWTRANAKRLNIDPNRIAAGGGSAGGHLAAATAVLPGFEDGGHLRVSAKPNALLLFNPALVLAPLDGASPNLDRNTTERFGADPVTVSPIHHVGKTAPPTIIFHGKADTTVPYSTVEAYQKKASALGTKCVLEGYEGQAHGFFNYGRGDGSHYRKTTERMVEFLREIGYVK
ncbi:MAG: alpha/beta hydrolase [Acidobacteria bacterium]|nr:alpha/beta hydrolase [Acidobacteriota bacterium]